MESAKPLTLIIPTATLMAADLLSAELAKHGEARQAGELAPGRGSGFGFRQPLRVRPLMGTKCMVGPGRPERS
jgi:hypothetical protein